MNTKLLLALISVAVFSSCTTMYKSGQTPDDVYYSPERTYGEGKTEERVERNEQYYSEDRAIRMGINDSRWRYLDNDYGYNVYYSPYNQYYSPYNYGFNHGYYYNPYFWPYPVYSPIFVAPSNPKVTTPRSNNLGGYGTVRGYNNAPLNPKAARTGQVRNYNNNNGSAVGNAIRRVMTTPSNNNRTYTPSNNTSSSSSGSSSSGSSGGGISRPPRSGSK